MLHITSIILKMHPLNGSNCKPLPSYFAARHVFSQLSCVLLFFPNPNNHLTLYCIPLLVMLATLKKHLEKFSHPEPPKSFQHLEIFQGPSQPPHPNSTRTGFWCLQPYHSPSQAPTKGGGRPGNNSPKSLQHLEIFRTPQTYPPNPTRNMDPRWLPPPNMAGSMPQGLI
jgi:hypothetical protein